MIVFRALWFLAKCVGMFFVGLLVLLLLVR